MKTLLLRADDLGFSEAVNCGIAKTVREGLIRNCGVMVNMDATPHAVELFRELPCCLGLHCNVSVGRPLCPPDRVPTLVDEHGEFFSGSYYRKAREEFACVEDFCRELTAQYRRFLELFGRRPAYFEAHAVESKNLGIALERVAEENGLFYQPSFRDFTLGGTRVINTPMHSMEPGYDARAALKRELSQAEEGSCHLYVCHPGWLDAYLLAHTSLTLPRADEADMLCDPAIRDWLTEQGFVLTTYDQLAGMEQQTQGKDLIGMGFFDKLWDKAKSEAPAVKDGKVLSPVGGEVIALEDFPDAVFSQGVLGPGCGILPTGDTIVSPFDGTVTQLTDTMHAIGVTSAGGVEVLIHVGVDTVEMAGSGFRSLVKEGQRLHTGDPLIQFDREAIRAAGHADAVAVVVTNADEFSAVERRGSGTVTAGEVILEAVK